MKKFFFLFLLISFQSWSQSYFYSFGVGANLFKGDVHQWNLYPSLAQLKTMQPSIHGEFGIQVNKAFDLRARLSVGRINGDALARRLPNVNLPAYLAPYVFKSNLVELGLQFDYNFFNFKRDEETDFNWTPYFTSGIAGFYANPTYHTIDPRNVVSLAIPYGVGVKWKLNRKIMFRMEGVARKTFTERLDWFVNSEVENLNEFTNNSYFGLSKSDQYFNFSISLIYSIYPPVCPNAD